MLPGVSEGIAGPARAEKSVTTSNFDSITDLLLGRMHSGPDKCQSILNTTTTQ